ncbi:unnamed protein product [Miscanthus lutarioriparius]|uniref:KIB1-4 beta-propeller domain-containing protein n=1 Tax=Miscanthus lutarioriparius TaxID=422564 RepID=A0A811QI62_9POAL|nr:unnamed protein product [Miscanthus lutarioriparius]
MVATVMGVAGHPGPVPRRLRLLLLVRRLLRRPPRSASPSPTRPRACSTRPAATTTPAPPRSTAPRAARRSGSACRTHRCVWLATADEASNLHLVNPLSGAQVALPPVTTLYHVESFLDGGGSLVYSVQESEDRDNPEEPPVQYPAQKLRLFLYYKVVMSCSPSKGRDCVVLLLHRPGYGGMIQSKILCSHRRVMSCKCGG